VEVVEVVEVVKVVEEVEVEVVEMVEIMESNILHRAHLRSAPYRGPLTLERQLI